VEGFSGFTATVNPTAGVLFFQKYTCETSCSVRKKNDSNNMVDCMKQEVRTILIVFSFAIRETVRQYSKNQKEIKQDETYLENKK
jgi:hypothetical protein